MPEVSIHTLSRPTTMFDLIAFDADDTLWHNETTYVLLREKLKQLLAGQVSSEIIASELFHTETNNIPYFGFGIKSYTLSMIETAIRLTNGNVPAQLLQQIIEQARRVNTIPLQLLDSVQECVARLAETHTLMMITKGDSSEQESKIARSGLARYFKYIEIVSDKTEARYETILARYNVTPERWLMVGNSMKSDICPVLALGGWAVYIHYPGSWAYENDTPPQDGHHSYFELDHIGELPALVDRLEQSNFYKEET